MGTYTGTIGDDTITPSIVSPGVFRDPPGTFPSAAADLIKGFGGIDTIDGGDGDDDIVSGTGGDPVAVADGGADTINGGAGDDTIIDDSQAVGNVLHGDDGNDRILGLAGGVGADTINGGAGDDQIYAGWVGNVLHGDAGNDVINIAIIDTGGANPATNTAWGDDGNDRIDLSYTTNSGNFSWVGQGPTGTIKLDGGAGDDQVFVDAPVDTLLNMAGTTVFLYGGTGNDMIYGNAGNDQIYGGRSDDDREDGPDTIYGDDGNDTVWAGGGNDVVYGGTGDDNLYGQSDNDTMYGGAGNERVYGGTGNDTLYGDDGVDNVRGGDGLDRVSGGGGNDRYDYDSIADSKPGAANRDVILDYNGVGAAVGDTIDLSTIDANTGVSGNQAFVFKGTGAITGPGQVHLVASGADTLIQANTGGTTAPELEVLVHDGTALPTQWVAGDFIL